MLKQALKGSLGKLDAVDTSLDDDDPDFQVEIEGATPRKKPAISLRSIVRKNVSDSLDAKSGTSGATRFTNIMKGNTAAKLKQDMIEGRIVDANNALQAGDGPAAVSALQAVARVATGNLDVKLRLGDVHRQLMMDWAEATTQ